MEMVTNATKSKMQIRTLILAALTPLALHGCSDSNIDSVRDSKPDYSTRTYGEVFDSRDECNGAKWNTESRAGGDIVVTATCELTVSDDELEEMKDQELKKNEEFYDYLINSFAEKKNIARENAQSLEVILSDWPNNSPKVLNAINDLNKAIARKEKIQAQTNEEVNAYDPNARQLALDMLEWQIDERKDAIEIARKQEIARAGSVNSELEKAKSIYASFISIESEYLATALQRREQNEKSIEKFLGRNIEVVNIVEFNPLITDKTKITKIKLTLNEDTINTVYADGIFFGQAMLLSDQEFLREKFKSWYMGKIRENVKSDTEHFPYTCSTDRYTGGCERIQ